MSFEILQSWGVASARHTSGCTVNVLPSTSTTSSPAASQDNNNTEHWYDIPLGPSVIRWDLSRKKRLMQFQAHPDLVTCLRKSPNERLVATSSHSGVVKLWTSEWICLDETKAPMESQFHMAWSKDSKRILIVGNGWKSSLVVYDLLVGKSKSKPKLTVTWILQASDEIDNQQPLAQDTKSGRKVVQSSSREEEEEIGVKYSGNKNYPYVVAYFMAEFNPTGHLFAVKEIPYKTAIIELISVDGQILRTLDLMLAMKESESVRRPMQTLFISSFHNGVYAIGVEGGRIVLVDAEALTIRKTFTVGSGFRTCVWDGDCLVIPSDSGKVTWWSEGGDKVAQCSSGLHDTVVHVDLSLTGNGLWICGFTNLAFFNIERNEKGTAKALLPSMAVQSHDITSVGIGFNPSGRWLGSGDLIGKVWVTEKESCIPLHKCSVSGSVRCLVWVAEDKLLIGTLDGNIYWWPPREPYPEATLQLEGSVICMHMDHQLELLAVGTSKGKLAVYAIKSDVESDRLSVIIQKAAHHPHSGPQDQRFGQLGKQAEIWNLCWSPDDTKLATCSEDQSVKVWDTKKWKSINTLTGHVLAVTCVDWTQHQSKSLLASCSDDRTVRLYDGETYNLLDVVNSMDIYGWHTLTYLSFYPSKECPLLLCTTQNGHVLVWKVGWCQSDSEKTKVYHDGRQCVLKRVCTWQLHLGSIEGLAWQDQLDKGSLATVGGDCAVNLFRFCAESTVHNESLDHTCQ